MSDQEEVPQEEGPQHMVAPSGQPAEGTVLPAEPVPEPETEEELGSIADNDEVPDSEEEVDQTEAPIDPEEADETLEEDA